MNEITILLFATLRDRAGTKSLNLQIPAEATVADLKNRLGQEFPQLDA
jgi:molybdopterin converting factor small subunit